MIHSYWSSWFTKEELRSMGAIGLIPAEYSMCYVIPGNVWQHHYAFQADETFPLFLRIKTDKSVVKISNRYYSALQRGEIVKVGIDSKPDRAFRECMYDF